MVAPALRPGSVGHAGDVWALLVAGSAGWYNYRHQADIAHVRNSRVQC